MSLFRFRFRELALGLADEGVNSSSSADSLFMSRLLDKEVDVLSVPPEVGEKLFEVFVRGTTEVDICDTGEDVFEPFGM